MPLSDTQIKKLKPTLQCTPNRPDKYSDGNGLQLWVRHTGNKVWVNAYRYAGKQQVITLGKYPSMSLAEARGQNLEIKAILDKGNDPRAEKIKHTTSRDGSHLFSTLAEQYHAQRKDSIKPHTYSRDYSQYERDIKPFIGGIDINDLTPPEILTIGRRIEDRGAGDMARRAIRQVGQVYLHAMRLGIVKYDPTIVKKMEI